MQTFAAAGDLCGAKSQSKSRRANAFAATTTTTTTTKLRNCRAMLWQRGGSDRDREKVCHKAVRRRR